MEATTAMAKKALTSFSCRPDLMSFFLRRCIGFVVESPWVLNERLGSTHRHLRPRDCSPSRACRVSLAIWKDFPPFRPSPCRGWRPIAGRIVSQIPGVTHHGSFYIQQGIAGCRIDHCCQYRSRGYCEHGDCRSLTKHVDLSSQRCLSNTQVQNFLCLVLIAISVPTQ